MIFRNKISEKDYNTFIEKFDSLDKINAPYMEAYYRLSIYSKQMGDYDRAFSFAEKSLKNTDKIHLEINLENVKNIRWLKSNQDKITCRFDKYENSK
jgi:tetratricopeptide (TPR) repeat protein